MRRVERGGIEATTKILVVDDDAKPRVCPRLVSGRPVEVLDASDGDEGVRRAISENPDIILMDLMMPAHQRLRGVAAARGRPATSGIPVILLSARREPQTKREAFDAGSTIRREALRPRRDGRAHPLDAREAQDVPASSRRKRRSMKDRLRNYRVFYKKLREEWERSEAVQASRSRSSCSIWTTSSR
jgi:CheY-like chemotaxis protein